MKSLTIDAKSLTKRYGDHVAVVSLDLQLKSGECFGLLGPNGAGKSSLLKMLCARTPMTSGEAYVLGFELKTHAREAKLKMGVMSQESGLEMHLTVLENLRLFATYFGMDRKEAQTRAEEVMGLVRIEKEKDRLVCELSGGWQKRVSLARALLNRPQVLILDEPTHSLDPIGKRRLWELLKQVRSDLGTILLSTHDILEAESLCDRVALMSRGRILVQGSPEDLVKEKVGDTVI
ncbi:MAG: ABC transporter ATP-binding protein, partial [Bdellovibrio sp.]